MSKFNVGDKVVRLEYKPNSLWKLGSTPVTIAELDNEDVKFQESETLVGTCYWGLDCYELYQPKSEVTMKAEAINVINQSSKVQRKLSATLIELGYPLDQAFDGTEPRSSTRIFNKYRNHDLYAEAFCTNTVTVNAEGKKFKAVLAEVVKHLDFSTDKPVVGDKVVIVANPENLAEVYVGQVGLVTSKDKSSLPLKVDFKGLDKYNWWFNYDSVRLLKPSDKLDGAPTEEPVSTNVDASTPVGTKVRVISKSNNCNIGAVGTLTRHDDDEYPRVNFSDDFWYPRYSDLEVVPDDTEVTVCKPEVPSTVRVPEPVELTSEDFKFTRVRVKSTGAEGVVIGRGSGGYSIGVLHDAEDASLHAGNYEVKGAYKRTWFYLPDSLEII